LELDTFKRNAKNAGLTAAAYLREHAIGNVPPFDLEQIAFEVRRLGIQTMVIRESCLENQTEATIKKLDNAVNFLLARADELTKEFVK
jgi:hypothetical protein